MRVPGLVKNIAGALTVLAGVQFRREHRMMILFARNMMLDAAAHPDPRSDARDFRRASGDTRCWACGAPYHKHLPYPRLLDWDGHPYLNVLCDGRLVKL